jgi:hypothetical protein
MPTVMTAKFLDFFQKGGKAAGNIRSTPGFFRFRFQAMASYRLNILQECMKILQNYIFVAKGLENGAR